MDIEAINIFLIELFFKVSKYSSLVHRFILCSICPNNSSFGLFGNKVFIASLAKLTTKLKKCTCILHSKLSLSKLECLFLPINFFVAFFQEFSVFLYRIVFGKVS